ncbi:hypothetical protein [Nocardioides flavescens]|uniref:Uncharacterized protein n=1 Tax=Nocardioides flavescens TaxID=2691959 RepID=A0A6L7EX62_9ACTN|nr:hypothetical protein [Nocardioides flavescens]MXG88855.1 hypothetical protein [Nocardioides flavescens]
MRRKSRTPRRTLVLTTAGGLSLLLAAPALALRTTSVTGGTAAITAGASGDTAAITCTGSSLVVDAVATTTACSAITDFDIQLDGWNNTLSFPGATTASFPAVRQVRVDSANGLADPDVTGSPYDVVVVAADALDTVNTFDGSDRISAV